MYGLLVKKEKKKSDINNRCNVQLVLLQLFFLRNPLGTFNNRIKQLQKIKVTMSMKIQYTVLTKLSANSEFFDEKYKRKKNLSLFNRQRLPNYIKQKITLRQRFDVVYGLFCV